MLALVALGRQDDVVLKVKHGLAVALKRLEVQNEIILDGKDGVSRQPGVVFGVQLCCAAFEAFVGDLRMVLAVVLISYN